MPTFGDNQQGEIDHEQAERNTALTAGSAGTSMTGAEPAGALFVAGRGTAVTDGLHYFAPSVDGWTGTQLATVDELAALCWHPTLPIIYGLSGLGRGLMHAWHVEAVPSGPALSLAKQDCLGEIPCDLAVDPSGRLLVAANFGSGTLTVWSLDERGVPGSDGEIVRLEGPSLAELPQQAGPHPHQIVFDQALLYVPDYGADLLRRFAVEPELGAAAALQEIDGLPVPAGTAPRHMVLWRTTSAATRLALSGELASSFLVGPRDGSAWGVASSTRRTGAARTRHPRNYPGDLKLSIDGRHVYFANRGYDTIAVFALEDDQPRLLTEVEALAAWPQHLLVQDHFLLVAGWDSSTVVALPLTNGLPGEPHVLFECPGAAWLLPSR
ncbi:MAG: 6-phosphogluconolactonase [Propionibacteriaceae bacterium]|nr:6-phosphogluconolactonase [Propionibacteriaceae bacterium]